MPSKIPNNFLFFFILCLAFATPNTALSADQETSQQQLNQLKKNITKVNHWLSKANTEKSGLSKQLEKQDKEIEQISKSIRSTSAKISQQVKKLNRLNKQSKQQKASLNQQKTFLIKQIRTAYLQGKQPGLKMLLDSDKPQDIARYMHYFSYINDARNEKIMTFQSSLTKLK